MLCWRTVQTIEWSWPSVEPAHCHVAWCDDSDTLASMWSGPCTPVPPTCTWFDVELAASAAGVVVAWCVIALAPGEWSVLHCSEHAVASGWNAVKHSVAVLEPWQYQTTEKRLCKLAQIGYISQNKSPKWKQCVSLEVVSYSNIMQNRSGGVRRFGMVGGMHFPGISVQGNAQFPFVYPSVCAA